MAFGSVQFISVIFFLKEIFFYSPRMHSSGAFWSFLEFFLHRNGT